MSAETSSRARTGPSVGDLWRYFLRLGAVGFGGPVALVGDMQRDLVEQRGWVTEDEYREGLAFSQLAPGPLAAQLAMYIGWLRGGARGATAVGIAFVLPSFAMVTLLAAMYVRAGGMAWMRAAFYGIGAAVIAVIARSAFRLARTTLRRDALLWSVFLVNAAVTALTESELASVILGSGVLVLLMRSARRRRPVAASIAFPVWLVPAWLTSGLHGAATVSDLARVFLFFTKAGALVFGSGLAIVPFMYGGAVESYGWLSDREFLDAVAVSMITPGPVVITVAFVGYLAAGPAGAVGAALGVFLPVYLAVVLLAPSFRRLASNAAVRAFVDGVTAAATGAIAGVAIVLGRRAIVDLPTAIIAGLVLTTLLLVRSGREQLLILGAGAAGLLVYPG